MPSAQDAQTAALPVANLLNSEYLPSTEKQGGLLEGIGGEEVGVDGGLSGGGTRDTKLPFWTRMEYLGSATGVIGAFLLAIDQPYSPLGWISFAISNIALIAFSYRRRLKGILFMQLAYTITTLVGLINFAVPYAKGLFS